MAKKFENLTFPRRGIWTATQTDRYLQVLSHNFSLWHISLMCLLQEDEQLDGLAAETRKLVVEVMRNAQHKAVEGMQEVSSK